jgi:hypothetical protein
MSGKIIYIIALIALVISATAFESYAQESAMLDVEMIDTETDRLRERAMYSPGESESVRYAPASEPKDSIINTTPASGSKNHNAVQTAAQVQQPKIKTEKPVAGKAPAAPQKQAKNDDDSLLSFNFLYYIIEKYKLQDIVD